MPMFEQIVYFTTIEPSDELQRAVEHQAKKQKNYKRKHQVKTISDFGINREQVKQDFAFLYKMVRLMWDRIKG